jgi:hypothetical protein
MKKNILSSLLTALFIPSLTMAQVGLAPLNDDQTYSLVTVLPDVRGNSKLEGLNQKIKEKISGVTNQVMQTAKMGLLQPKTLNSAFTVLASSLETELKPFVQEINKDLPDDAVFYTSYIVPYAKDETASMATLPLVNSVQIIETDLGQLAQIRKSAVAEFYSRLKMQITDINATKINQFQVAAVATHIKLSRNNVFVRFQLLGELKSGSREFPKANEQVVINDLEILSDPVNKLRPMALLNVTQKISTKDSEKTELPEIQIDFGAYGGISGGLQGWKGSLQILDDALNPSNTCAMKFNTVPSFFGFLAEKATGNKLVDYLMHNKPVRFRLLGLSFDAETQRISRMKMATQIGMAVDPYTSLSSDPQKGKLFNCLDVKSVDEKFAAEGNDAIDAALKEITSQNDVTPELMEALYE